MLLLSYFRIFQLSLISSSSNQTIVNKFANFLNFFFRNRINQDEFFEWSIVCDHIWNAFAWIINSIFDFRNRRENFETRKKIMNRQFRFCYLFFRFQIFQISLIRHSNANIFRHIYVDLYAIWNSHWFMFFQFFRFSTFMLFSIKSYCDEKKTNSMFIYFDTIFDDFAFSIFCSIFCFSSIVIYDQNLRHMKDWIVSKTFSKIVVRFYWTKKIIEKIEKIEKLMIVKFRIENHNKIFNKIFITSRVFKNLLTFAKIFVS